MRNWRFSGGSIQPRWWLAAFPLLLLAVSAATAVAQTIAWDPLYVEFGPVPIGSTENRTFVLTNTDENHDLVINNIEFEYNDRDAFGVSPMASLPAVLSPGESVQVECSFTPPDFSFFSAFVVITNSSTNAPSVYYQLMGEGRTGTTLITTTTTLAVTTTLTTTTTLPAGTCGDPVDDSGGSFPSTLVTASDALFVLHTSVGLRTCQACLCDVNGSGVVTATDALATLHVAVGLPVPLLCPPCT